MENISQEQIDAVLSKVSTIKDVIAKVDEVGNLFLLVNSSIGYKYDSKIGLLKESECEQKF